MPRKSLSPFFSISTALCALTSIFTPSLIAQVGGGSETLYHWDGAGADNFFGSAVSNAGDVNADGTEDILVGSSHADAGGISRAGLAEVYSGLDGSLLYQWWGTEASSRFGDTVSAAGDLNADGFDDVIVGAMSTSVGGSVYAFSGASGALLFQWNGSAAGGSFGSAVANLGDINQDGFDDVVVGARYASPGGLHHAGSAFAFSGADGSILLQWHAQEAENWFGTAVSGAGDVNADGTPDILVGATAVHSGFDIGGAAYLYSGTNGALLHELNGGVGSSMFGCSVSRVGDLNQDGYADVIVGAYRSHRGSNADVGSAHVFSGADGSLMYRPKGKAAHDQFGISVSGVGDVNGDGISEFIVGSGQNNPPSASGPGKAYLYSGADGSVLHQWSGVAFGDRFGESVSGIADLNGDGLAEVIVGSFLAAPNGSHWAGSAFVFSFRPYLQSSSRSLSASIGGVIPMDLDFPAAAAFEDFKVLVSASGVGPTNFGVEIPLTQDWLVQQTFNGVYRFFSTTNFQGSLDPNGDASASMTIAAGQPARLIGRTFWVAAIANQPGQLPEYSSVAIPIKFIP